MKKLVSAGLVLISVCCAPMGHAEGTAIPASALRAGDALRSWSDLLTDLFPTGSVALAPHLEARAFAVTHLAMAHAIQAVHDRGQTVGADDSTELAAGSAAAHDVLTKICPAAVARIEAVAATYLARVATEKDRARALEAGRAAAALILAQREHDGWRDRNDVGGSGLRSTLSLKAPMRAGNAGAMSPWVGATPFVLKSAQQVSVRLPYWRNVDGEALPDVLITRASIFDKVDRATPLAVLAEFWSESPFGAWNRVSHALLVRSGLGLAEQARILALVNVAMADATLAALHAQAMLGQWQARWSERWTPGADPSTAADTEVDVYGTGNSATFHQNTRPILSPPLRNYPTLSAAVAAAACAGLGAIPNVERIAFKLAPASNHGAGLPLPRTFANVRDAARECAFAASLDGQNSRDACVAGFHFGDEIGRFVLKRMRTSKP